MSRLSGIVELRLAPIGVALSLGWAGGGMNELVGSRLADADPTSEFRKGHVLGFLQSPDGLSPDLRGLTAGVSDCGGQPSSGVDRRMRVGHRPDDLGSCLARAPDLAKSCFVCSGVHLVSIGPAVQIPLDGMASRLYARSCRSP
jgi:hypothetical protein